MKKIYFASDFHIGVPTPEASRLREQKILRWLNRIEHDAKAIFLVGDIFDFWFEYKTVVPKGAIRLLGKIAELSDRGIDIHFFVGNHDIWMFDYFPNELGVTVHHHPIQLELGGKYFFIGHGDGLGPEDYGYKRLKKIFTNRFCQWLFGWLHPDIGMRIANRSSSASRTAQIEPEYFLGKDKEWLLLYANYKIKQLPFIDYFIFGHRHLPLDILLDNQHSRYINLGEWFNQCTYAEFDGQELHLKAFENPSFKITTIR
ncbi:MULTISPECIES: UDP-2,3-diacylglucosamine diphosphatase [unclassified Aureispira]|uniref:UDP-2,3-diacylglucosamine diphosphatase n=1 Tax=unclassified Aureispira TaxID=2649989 RepID=UPI000697119C|nr:MULTISPECIES: UDP-2,3-diacylglucosamine diphosphatase [unclassified Aureispira]WMX14688.1 UDP-2,3-diacylglucosamine diphosphatase [Aureispira sp. CCB-E]